MSSNRKHLILLIEDEIEIARFIEVELQCEGYQVEVCHDGMKGLIKARELNPDLVILDRMLPGLDGIEICKRINNTTKIPVIMLTAKSEVNDIVEGLDAGANDYLAKPFQLDELLARIRAQLRLISPQQTGQFLFMDLSLNTQTHEVKRNGKQIHLRPKEFEVLHVLIEHPRQVFAKESLIQKVWGFDFQGEDNVVEVCIYKLREKIEDKELPKLIHTIHGVGYVLKEPI